MSGFFFSPALRKLTQGSFENLIAQLDEVLTEKVKATFGEETQHRIIGTFPDNVVVVLSTGKTARFSFVEKSGVLVIQGHTLLEVDAMDPKALQSEVKEALRGLMKDDVDAGARLASLVSTN